MSTTQLAPTAGPRRLPAPEAAPPVPEAAPAPEAAPKRRRVTTALLTAVALTSAVVVVQQIGAADLVGVLLAADPVWLVVALAASTVPLLGAALSLAAFTPGRLPLRRTVAVQLASSYVGVVMPPSVGQLAVGARYLSRLGHSRAATAAALGLTQVASLAVTLVLLAGALAVTGTALALPEWLTTTALVVAAGTGLAALVAGSSPVVRTAARRALARWSADVLGQLRAAGRDPSRLLAGLGGSLLVTAGYVVALDASLRAVGTALPLAQTAVVVLAGTALGSVAPTPGGAVAVEAALTAGLVAAGVPVALALPAVLVHRAATLWLRVPPGLLALVLLRRRGVL